MEFLGMEMAAVLIRCTVDSASYGVTHSAFSLRLWLGRSFVMLVREDEWHRLWFTAIEMVAFIDWLECGLRQLRCHLFYMQRCFCGWGTLL